jgi:hypothetical protein
MNHLLRLSTHKELKCKIRTVWFLDQRLRPIVMEHAWSSTSCLENGCLLYRKQAPTASRRRKTKTNDVILQRRQREWTSTKFILKGKYQTHLEYTLTEIMLNFKNSNVTPNFRNISLEILRAKAFGEMNMSKDDYFRLFKPFGANRFARLLDCNDLFDDCRPPINSAELLLSTVRHTRFDTKQLDLGSTQRLGWPWLEWTPGFDLQRLRTLRLSVGVSDTKNPLIWKCGFRTFVLFLAAVSRLECLCLDLTGLSHETFNRGQFFHCIATQTYPPDEKVGIEPHQTSSHD